MQVHVLDRAFPVKALGTDPCRYLQEQPLGAARSKAIMGLMTHGLLLHDGVDIQEIWVVTSVSLEDILAEACSAVQQYAHEEAQHAAH